MKITAILKCDRCEEQFILPAKAGDSILPVNGHEKVDFKTGDKLVRHRYIKGIGTDNHGYFESTKSDIVAFCEVCDKAYWENF